MIAGLGNPGRQYMGTRHNCGFMALDILGRRYDIGYPDDGFKAMYGKGRIGGESVILLKPLTYMNLSGDSVSEIIRYYKIPLDDVIIIYDDIDVEPGTIKIRKKGGPGGHNGMKSLVHSLQTEEFARIRVGTGNCENKEELIGYVIGKTSNDE